MTPELEAHVAERVEAVALLQRLYRFSPQEAEDFIDRFPVDKPVSELEQAA